MTYPEFIERYGTDEQCYEELHQTRYPKGFVCPKCGVTAEKPYRIKGRLYLRQCPHCLKQTSLLVGTVMEGTHIPLRKWFLAFKMISMDKRGASALALKKELKVSYKTAWYLLKRIQTAMEKRDESYVLSGFVELDESFFGAADEETKCGRGTTKTQVMVGVEIKEFTNKKGKKVTRPTHIKMKIIGDIKKETVGEFVEKNIADGSTVSTDALASYNEVARKGHIHKKKVFNPTDDREHLKWLHTTVANAKALILGTFHGLDRKHLHFYLSEFCWRFNRKNNGNIFHRLLFACTQCVKICYSDLTT